jgi:flagellar motor switch protein FliN/FliY
VSNLARVTDVAPVEQWKLDEIQEVPLVLKASLARGMISLRKLSELKVGDVVPLQKAVGENIDVYAGDVSLGSAEVLVMDGVMAIQITGLCEKPAALPEQDI